MSVPFAETASLRIRGYRESDFDKFVALLSDPRIIRTDPAYAVPASPEKFKKLVEESLSLLMFCVLEAKTPLEDGNDWVGIVTLKNRMSPKNRNSMFGICLDAKFWGNGYGARSTVSIPSAATLYT
jgi:RimJ/RimL family protein N-acetyltransferase